MNMTRWLNHFRENRTDRPEPDWSAPISLSTETVRTLVPSLEQFELGDGGGPAYLIAWNREKFLARPSVRQLVDLWFKEEKEHSRLLGDAVRRFGGRKIDGHWSFSVFCMVRKYLGVAFELRALLLTEIVSNVYYHMLRRHADDAALRTMCDLVIRDETSHIAFHRDRLADATSRRYAGCWTTLFRMMGLAAGTMLWINHSPALKSLGATSSEFYGGIWTAMSRFVRQLRRDRQERSAHQDSAAQHLAQQELPELTDSRAYAGKIATTFPLEDLR